MAEQYSIVYMYLNFFIYSSVDGHLGCFHVLAIVNSAAANSGIHVSFSTLVNGSDGKASAHNEGRPGFNPWVGKIPWRRKWQPIPVPLPGKSHGWGSLVGLQFMGSNTTERLHSLHFPQCICLEVGLLGQMVVLFLVF